MTQTLLLYVLLGCGLSLLAWPLVSFYRGRLDGVGLAVSLSIPVLVAAVMLVGATPARAQTGYSVAPGVKVQTPPASSIAGPYSHWFPPGQTGWVLDIPPRITPSPSSGGSGPGVNVGGSGTAVVTRPNAPNIRVPVDINTRIPASAAARAAARAAGVAARSLGPVGAAWTGWAIYQEVRNSGIHICPPPAFFCFPPTENYDRTKGTWRLGLHNDLGTIGDLVTRLTTVHFPGSTVLEEVHTKSGETPLVKITLRAKDGGRVDRSIQFVSGEFVKNMTPGPAMSEGDMAGKMGNHAGSDSTGNTAANMYGAAADADTKMRQQGEAGVPQNVMQPPAESQTQVTSPPVVVSDEPLGTKTNTNPDGSTSTTTSTGQATITPTTSGHGSATTITYNYNYNITNTTQTGNGPPVTNTETIIIRVEPEPVPPSQPTEFPKDYNKEATQLRIENLLKGEGMPDGTALSSEAAETSIKGAQSQMTGAIDQVTPEGLGLASWLPDIPTAACVNPTVPNPIDGGSDAEIEICKPVSLFSKFISAVICVFVLYGCVREVQGAIKS